MNSKPMLIVVACALIDTDNRVLVTSRPDSKSMAGLWEFPGGKLETGESPEAALERELKEELGITITETSRLCQIDHDYAHARVRLHVYLVYKWLGEPRSIEGQEMAWALPEDIARYDLLEAAYPILEQAAVRLARQ